MTCLKVNFQERQFTFKTFYINVFKLGNNIFIYFNAVYGTYKRLALKFVISLPGIVIERKVAFGHYCIILNVTVLI